MKRFKVAQGAYIDDTHTCEPPLDTSWNDPDHWTCSCGKKWERFVEYDAADDPYFYWKPE